MKNPYYLIWSDALLSIKKHHPKKKSWKIEAYILVSFVHSINFWIIFIWLKYFSVELPVVKVDIFLGDNIDSFIGYLLTFAWPFLLLNYLLVFYKDRYKIIMNKYTNTGKSYAYSYSMAIILSGFASFILYAVLT